MNVCVIGAGTMGNGIAHVFALSGFVVQLLDIDKTALDKGYAAIQNNLSRQLSKEQITEIEMSDALQRISLITASTAIFPQSALVVEAISENVILKSKVLKEVAGIVSDKTIIATNTSSISITKLASAVMLPGRVIGMHFMNPVPIMQLVEVINGYHTSEACTNTIIGICKKIGKKAVVVNDYPGFVANRILMPMINEAIHTLHEGIAGVTEIDEIMKLGMAHPMGPLQLADYIGLDICKNILEVLHEGFGDAKFAPNILLVNMVTAGELGVKSGRGFYDWTNGGKNPSVSPKFL